MSDDKDPLLSYMQGRLWNGPSSILMDGVPGGDPIMWAVGVTHGQKDAERRRQKNEEFISNIFGGRTTPATPQSPPPQSFAPSRAPATSYYLDKRFMAAYSQPLTKQDAEFRKAHYPVDIKVPSMEGLSLKERFEVAKKLLAAVPKNTQYKRIRTFGENADRRIVRAQAQLMGIRIVDYIPGPKEQAFLNKIQPLSKPEIVKNFEFESPNGKYEYRTSCLSGDTQVITRNGNAKISSIREGDCVLAWNEDHGEYWYHRISEIHTDGTYAGFDSYTILSDGAKKPIDVESYQKFWTKNKKGEPELTMARNIRRGDKILTSDGEGPLVWKAVVSVGGRFDRQTYYDIKTESKGGICADGFLVFPSYEHSAALTVKRAVKKIAKFVLG